MLVQVGSERKVVLTAIEEKNLCLLWLLCGMFSPYETYLMSYKEMFGVFGNTETVGVMAFTESWLRIWTLICLLMDLALDFDLDFFLDFDWIGMHRQSVNPVEVVNKRDCSSVTVREKILHPLRAEFQLLCTSCHFVAPSGGTDVTGILLLN